MFSSAELTAALAAKAHLERECVQLGAIVSEKDAALSVLAQQQQQLKKKVGLLGSRGHLEKGGGSRTVIMLLMNLLRSCTPSSPAGEVAVPCTSSPAGCSLERVRLS
jgi:hypothetical protein